MEAPLRLTCLIGRKKSGLSTPKGQWPWTFDPFDPWHSFGITVERILSAA